MSCQYFEDTRTVLDWLCDVVNFPVSEGAAKDIIVERGVDPSSSVTDVDKRDKDLCKADLYVWLCTSPTRRGDTQDSDNSWSHKEGGFTLSADDKNRLMAMANNIYDMYEEEPVCKRVIKLQSFGIRKAFNRYEEVCD